MTKIAEKEALNMIRNAGFITRFKGYDIVIYKKVDAKTWLSFAKVRSANGFVNASKLNAAICAA